MRTKLSSLALALGAVGFALLLPAPAQAQATGATSVSIDIPDIVILHYFSTVDVTLDAAAMGTYLTGTPGDSSIDEGGTGGAANVGAGGFQVDLNIAPSALTGDPSNAVLLLQNAWGVRAISLGAVGSQTDLTIAVTNATLSNGGSQITIANATVDDGTSNASSIQFPSPGLAPALTGDVELTLDLSNTTAAGNHTGGVFTLTATNL